MSSVEACYVEIDGEYKPVNVTATGIKCLVCQQIYAPAKIQEHLKLHVKPSLQKGTMPTTSPQYKLNLDELSK